MSMKEILQIVPTITALIAVIVGPFFSWKIIKRQLKASVNSKNRQEWINTLRDEITNFLFCFIKLEGIRFNNAQEAKPLSDSEVVVAVTNQLDELQKHKLKIKLLMNPIEKDHIQLMDFLEDAYLNIKDSKVARAEIENRIVTQSRNILKREWERVKALE